MEFLATIVLVNDNLGSFSRLFEHNMVTAIATIILKRMWEGRNDFLFQDIGVDIERIGTLVDSNLCMEPGRIQNPDGQLLGQFGARWS